MKFLYLCCCLFILTGSVLGQSLSGTVTDTAGRSLAGASVSLAGTRYGTLTDTSGKFVIPAPEGNYRLSVSYVGFASAMRSVRVPSNGLKVVLRSASGQLAEVRVSTGYQELPKERATGSFVAVDKALLHRSVTTDVIGRLRDVVPGLSFNNLGTRISIRGQNTLFSNADPLIVVDGFAYNQPIENLNPADVASVTVLKDAAAASIWGARAGNGVIVITTNKGGYNRPIRVSASASVNVGERPDLYYQPRMSSADFIGIEQKLFASGYYAAAENSVSHAPLSPAVELMIANRDGQLSAGELDLRLKGLSALDVRRDLSRYFYRRSVNQQYALSLDGGTDQQRYYFSGGYDRNLDNAVGNGFERLTLNGNETWKLLKGRLEANAGGYISMVNTATGNPGPLTWNNGDAIYPYAQLADAAGNPLAVTHDLRESFVNSAVGAGLLDWSYRPLADLRLADNKRRETEVRLNTGLKYKIWNGLSAQVLYQYDESNRSSRNLMVAESFFARNIINRYTQDDGSGTLSFPIPRGGVLDFGAGRSVNHDGRLQLNYDGAFGKDGKNELNAIAGYQVQSLRVTGNEHTVYGYDADHATMQPVDGITYFGYYDNPASGNTIPLNLSESDATDHFLSYYTNAAYTYDRRISLSGSARLDRSNLFGVNTNQKGVPLWSAGLSWELSREGFYHVKALPYLKLRATFGYNGNINKNLSAYTTAYYFDGSNTSTRLPYAQVLNPPNPNLRWERNRQVNLGADFSLLDGRISGSAEVYYKRGLDLIGSTAYPSSSGIMVFTGNTAGTKGQGLDISLNTRNIVGDFNWSTAFFLSYVQDKVSRYQQQSLPSDYLNFGYIGAYALEGKPLYAIYSYRSTGLDPSTGDPRGYLNGQVSSDYAAMAAAATPQNLVYNGPSRPVTFGALRNTFGYKSVSLSFNIAYRLGYYFRRNSVYYGNDYGLSQQNGDYALRWQRPGDEQHTVIPSLPAAPDNQRDNFYRFSSALVEKGDNIRLQDVNLSYQFTKGRIKFLPGAELQVYLYAANLGILWRANRAKLDPDAGNGFPQPRTVAGGIRLTY
ncbi:SusC/RagA family TonB-linked outer membrane protein [Mucilaginibacter achroorhodeus]|nr:SusC/RagA family TonB-linked outer membrane protein [Mucilaginibacter achroorhodeus]